MSEDARVLKRVKTVAAEGKPSIQYRIQLVDKSLVDEVVTFLVEYLVPYETMISALDFISDAESLQEIKEVFKDALLQGISLVAFLENEQGDRGPMIGCNVMHLEKGDASEIKCKSEKLSTVFQTLWDIESMADMPKSFNCTDFVHTLGLVVAPAYKRQGIATEIVRAREDVCRMINIPVCASIFTAAGSIKAAANCGYETLSELDFGSYRINGKIAYPNPKWQNVKWMAKRYF